MAGVNSDISNRVRDLDKKINQFLSSVDFKDNVMRRSLYTDVELLKLDLEEYIIKSGSSKGVFDDIQTRLFEMSSKLPIIPIKHRNNLINNLEIIVRFFGVAGMFVLAGTIFALPIISLRVVDISLKRDPFHYHSETLKRFMLSCFIFLSGIHLHIEGLTDDLFRSHRRSVVAFSHASSLDGFLVAYACPIRQLAFGKKELFLAPFFSWISLAIGGIPVDRGNRDRAVKALKISVDEARQATDIDSDRLCIAIAPEGTRSLTGQFLPLKKGVIHLAEDISAPIIPFITFGAYDLYPVKSWVNNTGHVTVRFLPPMILTEVEKQDKDLAIRNLRRKMLLGIQQYCSRNIGSTIHDPVYYSLSLLMNLVSIMINYAIGYSIYQVGVIACGLAPWLVALLVLLLILAVTMILYIYYVYLIHLRWFGGKGSSSKKSKGDKEQ